MTAAREVDAVVVGGGAAGLAAASWLGRYRRSVVLVDAGQHRAERAVTSHGYLGRDPQRPLDLLADGRREVCAYPTASIVDTRVEAVVRRDDGRFDVGLADGAALRAHRLVLACGVVDVLPDVDGVAEHYGASLFHCPACDGYEARDRHVVALGWDAKLVGFSATLLNWARSVTVVTDGRRFDGDESCRRMLARNGVPLHEQRARCLRGRRGDLQGIELDDGRVLEASLVFFSIAHHPRTALARSLGCRLDDEGYVPVDDEGCTSVPGVYAAGDLVPGLQLTLVAAASGAVAGVGCAQSLFGTDGAPTAPQPAPDPTVPGQGG